MNPEQRSALEGALTKFRATAVDPDILKALTVPDDLNPQDSAAVEAWAKKMLEAHPALFRVEKRWDQMDPDSEEFRERESAFRASLANNPSIPKNDFKDLDAALLSPEEQTALTKYLGNRASKFEISILRAAKASQARLLGGAA